MTADLKTCKKCGESKPRTEFYVELRNKTDGRSARCKDCVRTDSKAWVAANGERKVEADRAYRAENADEIREKNKSWRSANPDRVKGYNKKWEAENPEVAAESRRKKDKKWRLANPEKVAAIQARRNANPDEPAKRHALYRKRYSRIEERIAAAVRAGVAKSIRPGSKERRRTFSLFDYSLQELRLHMERQFKPGMSWENYGEWHIDHIRPLASFSYEAPDDPEFKEAWALANLQPLWATDNFKKGARWTPPPPPANDNASSEAA